MCGTADGLTRAFDQSLLQIGQSPQEIRASETDTVCDTSGRGNGAPPPCIHCSDTANNQDSSLIRDNDEDAVRSPQHGKTASPLPGLPPGMAAAHSHTADEILQIVNKTPLFMTNLEKAGDEDGENIMLDAIRAIQYEGTRAEVALNFREQGNEAAKTKQWRDAKEFYTKGISVLMAKENRWDEPNDIEWERLRIREAQEACYINRALCNLELKNYRSTRLDCASTLKVNPKNLKAYYRSALALLALDQLSEADDAVSRGLKLDPTNQPLQQTASQVAARKTVLDRHAAAKRAEEDRARKEKLLLNTALQARQIRVKRTDHPPDLEDARLSLSPDPLSPKSTLVFPTMFLYPLAMQSDLIKAVSEMDSIADHLSYMLPPPWDSCQQGAESEYGTLSRVDCYMTTVTGGLIKAGKKLPLLKILSGGKVEVVDDLVTIFIVPSAKARLWIEEFKARKSQ